MFLSPFAMYLAALADQALRLLTGCPPSPPSFEGLLDDLYAHWPLDASELPQAGGLGYRAAA